MAISADETRSEESDDEYEIKIKQRNEKKKTALLKKTAAEENLTYEKAAMIKKADGGKAFTMPIKTTKNKNDAERQR